MVVEAGIDDDFAERISELRARHYAVAEALALTIAKSRSLKVRHLVIKAEILREALRPKEMGLDQPERWILLSLPEDIKRLCS
jgi:hypothetical protein